MWEPAERFLLTQYFDSAEGAALVADLVGEARYKRGLTNGVHMERGRG